VGVAIVVKVVVVVVELVVVQKVAVVREAMFATVFKILELVREEMLANMCTKETMIANSPKNIRIKNHNKRTKFVLLFRTLDRAVLGKLVDICITVERVW
jgi:hypothetical protein